MLSRAILLLSTLLATQVFATERWVPPPAPQVIAGETIGVAAEIYNESRFIIHLHKPKQVDWRETRYEVHLRREDDQPFSATLRTRAFLKDDEVIFLTIPKGTKDKYRIEVIDPSTYPHRRVFYDTLGAIPEISK